MYDLPPYRENDPAIIRAFMKAHPFAMLIGCSGNRCEATQIPLLFRESGDKLTLLGHMMRKQAHTNAFEENPEVLAVFTGAHTYVSATWYSNPVQASTWNYMSVHARGKMRFLDEAGLALALEELTMAYENGNARSSTVFHNLPEEYRSRLMKSIVAFEIEVESAEAVFKLSQNRDKESYYHIISRLKEQGADAAIIAGYMEQRGSQLFKENK